MTQSSKVSVAALSVESLMTGDVICLTPTMTIRESIETLINNRISGAPVVAGDKTVLTVVSESDLMKFAAMNMLETTVQTIMDKLVPASKVVAVRRQDTFKDVFKLFLTNRIRRVVVTDSSGRIQGIVSRSNILKAFMLDTDAIK
ncbi:MAG: CBS domain-containing protein [Bdellovibrionota bacterium]